MILTCGSEDGVNDATVDESNLCSPVISFTSKQGCATASLSAFWSWLHNNKVAMCIVFIALGLIVGFLGRKLFSVLLFLAGVLITVGLVMVIFYTTFLSDNTKSWVGWVVLGCSVLLGLLVGWLFIKLAKLGAFVLAGWGGFSLGLLLYNAFLYKINSQAFFWCFVIGLALICGVLALFFFDHVLILATALAGAYMTVYGIGLVAGHY